MAARTSICRFAQCCRSQLPISSRIAPLRSLRVAPILRSNPSASLPRLFSTSSAVEEKKYTQDHEWIELDSDGTTGTIGISVYAAHALGDVVYVELPVSGTSVSAGDTIGAVESVKSASDILTPVSGTIIEGNSLLEEKPGTINKGPEGEGWIAKIKVEDKAELGGLMDAEKYKAFTEE